MRYKFVTCDVFTAKRFGGNQLAVLPDARGLTDAQMLAVTREFGYSETVFVLPPEHGGTRRVRIYTPGGEVPFAGHPTVGCAAVLAHAGLVTLAGGRGRVVLEEGVGPVPVSLRAADRGLAYAQFTAAKLPETGPAPPPREALAAMLSLAPDDLLDGEWAPQGVSCGLAFLLVPLRDRDAVRRSRMRLDQWERTLKGWWSEKVLLFSRDPEHGGPGARARMYAPGIGVPEDPATGSAAAALAGYLAARDPRREGTLAWAIEQGYEMGRPSQIEIEADKHDGRVTAVRVGGNAVVVAEGEIEID
ncbi:MAG: PhzF family phenazine biosynthesis protein [Gemmatimonadaceae bacterium]